MKAFASMTREELSTLRDQLAEEYSKKKELGLALDMSRGKPAADQLNLTMDMLKMSADEECFMSAGGSDCRNYGIVDGVAEAKKLMADMIGAAPEQCIVGGNASLNLMYDCLMRAEMFGILGNTPWKDLPKVQFLCPVPGYDRHFRLLETMGINMINVPMTEDGPDMDIVEKLAAEDDTIKGIFCVPKFSNPSGIVYSDEVVRRMANLKPAAKDFRIFWDNAYAVHYIYPEKDRQPEILDIISECEKAGNPDMVYEFASTSKVTFPGAGISVFASSEANVKEYKARMSVQTIGYDKLNMLRHVAFLKDKETMASHMMKQAELLRPKFEAVDEILTRELGGLGIGSWTKPLGGYFISFTAVTDCAKEIVAKCKEAGVTMTGAGAAFPYGKDPQDSNIRIAPTYPTLSELIQAAELFTLVVKLVSAEKILKRMDIEPVIKKVFTEEDYRNIMALENHTTKEFYESAPVEDWVVKVTHKPQRFRTERMLYIVQLNHYLEGNLANDDMYWRAEPKKFFAGTPTLEQIWDALQENYEYFQDKTEFHMAKLNLTFDKPEFDS